MRVKAARAIHLLINGFAGFPAISSSKESDSVISSFPHNFIRFEVDTGLLDDFSEIKIESIWLSVK